MAEEVAVILPEPVQRIEEVMGEVVKRLKKFKRRVSNYHIGVSPDDTSLDDIPRVPLEQSYIAIHGEADKQLEPKGIRDPGGYPQLLREMVRGVFCLKDYPADRAPYDIVIPEGKWIRQEAVVRMTTAGLPSAEKRKLNREVRENQRAYSDVMWNINDLSRRVCNKGKLDKFYGIEAKEDYEIVLNALFRKTCLPCMRVSLASGSVDRAHYLWFEKQCDYSLVKERNPDLTKQVESFYEKELAEGGYAKMLDDLNAIKDRYIAVMNRQREIYYEYFRSLQKQYPRGVLVLITYHD